MSDLVSELQQEVYSVKCIDEIVVILLGKVNWFLREVKSIHS